MSYIIESYLSKIQEDVEILNEADLKNLINVPKKIYDSNFEFAVKIIKTIGAGAGLGAIAGSIVGVVNSLQRSLHFDIFWQKKYVPMLEGIVKKFGEAGEKLGEAAGDIKQFLSVVFYQIRQNFTGQELTIGITCGLLMSFFFVYAMFAKRKGMKEAHKETIQSAQKAGKDIKDDDTKKVYDQTVNTFKKSFKK